jgi:hypothetical protein
MPPFLSRWRDEAGDVFVLGAVRAALGVLLLANALRAAAELRRGYFGDVFHWPILPESLVASRGIYVLLVGLQLGLAILVVIGLRARDALLASALLGTYVLLCDRLEYHHNRWALFCYSAILALAPCDRSFRVGPGPGATVGPMWAVRLAQLQVSLVYLASGGSKLLDTDWRRGHVIAERFRLYAQGNDVSGALAWLLGLGSRPAIAVTLAASAIATELFLAVGLWSRRTRGFALVWGLGFHLIIEATSRVEGFTWLTLAMYGLFVAPDGRTKRLLTRLAAPFTRHAKAA